MFHAFYKLHLPRVSRGGPVLNVKGLAGEEIISLIKGKVCIKRWRDEPQQ